MVRAVGASAAGDGHGDGPAVRLGVVERHGHVGALDAGLVEGATFGVIRPQGARVPGDRGYCLMWSRAGRSGDQRPGGQGHGGDDAEAGGDGQHIALLV
ncbi:hypothetical protein [Actinoplanes nipponensis]|uniref:hypothetical protein n=1 Tax=Actinoplanes nipponensis TaxID=135950 RepID=UPI0031F14113